MFHLKKYVLCFAVLPLSVILNGCTIDEDDDADGYFQVVNLLPQSPSIEFIVEDSSFAELKFTEASDYTSVSNSTYDIEFNQVLPNTENENFIDDESLRIYSNTLHSYILYGQTSSPSTYELEMDVSDIYSDDLMMAMPCCNSLIWLVLTRLSTFTYSKPTIT
ncbi:MAG: DUF4397 domain-containing protein [Paraglaciecola sp.]|nr:DUF4397 domain-containing protein [Paraglaciecola sp.]